MDGAGDRGRGVPEILDAAADLLDKPGAWIQGNYARNSAGELLFLGASPDTACAWCVQGALCAVAMPGWQTANYFLGLHLGVINTAEWNDRAGRTREEVVAALRAAAADLARTTPSPQTKDPDHG